MNMEAAAGQTSGALPFFLQAEPGERFCMYYPPPAGIKLRGAMLYVHPFAEEMNKSRRMAALQARAFAASGYAVLHIDLFGCGDSSGDFSDARWHIWLRDLELACAWLEQRNAGPLALWGLRLGALLAVDLAQRSPALAERLILWHPVFQGKTYLDQFLRLHLATKMLAKSAAQAGEAAPASLREQLAAGACVEVGGYGIAPELAAAIDRQDMDATAPPCPVSWYEMQSPSEEGISRGASTLAKAWQAGGVGFSMTQLAGKAFWTSAEIVECRALLAATTPESE
jgi:exosortase A-associated hydrolase 2